MHFRRVEERCGARPLVRKHWLSFDLHASLRVGQQHDKCLLHPFEALGRRVGVPVEASLRAALLEHVDVGDSSEPVLQREQRITLELMRRHIAEHGEEAWRSVAGGGYSMPHQMQGRPRDL